MENDIENQDVDLENNEQQETDSEEQTDWEALAKQKDAEIAKYKRIAERNAKKAEKVSSSKEEPAKSDKSDFELDYGQKAFLRSYDIKGADELELVRNWSKRTGDPLDSIVEDDIFQAKLKGLRQARETAAATPKSTKRSASAPQDEVAVAIAEYRQSGKLPDSSDLRNKVWDEVLRSENKQFHNS